MTFINNDSFISDCKRIIHVWHYNNMSKPQTQAFVISMYKQACELARAEDYSTQKHQSAIISSLDSSGIPYKHIQKLVSYSQNDWVQDLLEVALDMQKIIANKQKNLKRYLNRARMHFGGQHYRHLLASGSSKSLRKILKMYEQQRSDENSRDYSTSSIYANSIYLMGLTKGNGVILNRSAIVSCAHVLVDEQTHRIFQIRCFASGLGSYGIIQTTKEDIFEEADVAFGKIIFYQDQDIPQVSLNSPKELKFQEFVPIQCIQIGLLYSPDEFVEPFYTAEGFVEANFYRDESDIDLRDEMGLLVHSCYGLHGTSGSPIWSSQGELIGLHNSWNSEGYNVSMIVHDDIDDDEIFTEEDECRVIRQYERRAISTHVLRHLHDQWTNFQNKKHKMMGKRMRKGAIIGK